VAVTEDDLRTWVEALAPAFLSSDGAYSLYLRGWDVTEKVHRAKLAGTFEATASAGTDRHNRLARRLGVHIPGARR
jgi:hypothetical protein